MKRAFALFVALFVSAGILGQSAHAASREEYEQLKRDMEALKAQVESTREVGQGYRYAPSRVDALVDNQYGPNKTVTTRSGSLKMGGLVQVWYYSIQNDNRRVFDPVPFQGDLIPGTGADFGSNEVNDNDSFRVRRAQLKFQMDIHENVTAFVMIDPAREATSFVDPFNNQSDVISGDGSAAFDKGVTANGTVGIGNSRNILVQNGSGSAARLLQDAYINTHGILPHHDGTVGQFRRRLGNEGSTDASKLDFIERSMITQLGNMRDLGAQIHGFWFDDRLQYWVGTFDGAGTAFQQRQNRSDTNDNRDLVVTILGRPLWRNETWGSLELGYSIMYGIGGESGGRFGGTDGLNRATTVHSLQYAWLTYQPEGPVRGWWIKGEWGNYRDRFAPGQVHSVGIFPPMFNVQGWYASTGYKLSDSIWADDLENGGTLSKMLLAPMEFVFRYDTMDNIFDNDDPNPTRQLDVFNTTVITAGFNYYIKGNNAKIQVNYNWVLEEDDKDTGANALALGAQNRQHREVMNNSLVVNFQVGW